MKWIINRAGEEPCQEKKIARHHGSKSDARSAQGEGAAEKPQLEEKK
jgi:hypothetical protein